MNRRRTGAALPALAVAASAAFTGGGLLTQTVIVPSWRRLEPGAALEAFRAAGGALGGTLFPVEIAAALLLGGAAWRAYRNGGQGRSSWALACGCMAVTVALFPLYFAGANHDLLDPGFAPGEVRAALDGWYAWNWARTGLAAVATALAVVGAARGGPGLGKGSP
ncbi:hypothetical protein [Streptomyces sp. NPDC048172]|uniref:hypothetical protein n=1 Tax=Streptomyces sp. NPDC048172 TaxID=3365505 RepID=UPI0037171D59